MDKLGYESGNTRPTGSEAETATIERWGHRGVALRLAA
jgi:hypothetical protein